MSEVNGNVSTGVDEQAGNKNDNVLFPKGNEAGDISKPETGKAINDGVDKVPEDGTYDLKMPEGVPLDEELFKALSPEFKELGLTQGQAQKLVDGYIKAQSGRMQGQGESFTEITQGWIEEAKADKEIGGDKWEATVSTARRAVEQFGTGQLRDYLTQSGAGNHPEVIRFMAKVGAMIGEDKPPQGGTSGNGRPIEAAHLLFSNDVVTKG